MKSLILLTCTCFYVIVDAGTTTQCANDLLNIRLRHDAFKEALAQEMTRTMLSPPASGFTEMRLMVFLMLNEVGVYLLGEFDDPLYTVDLVIPKTRENLKLDEILAKGWWSEFNKLFNVTRDSNQ